MVGSISRFLVSWAFRLGLLACSVVAAGVLFEHQRTAVGNAEARAVAQLDGAVEGLQASTDATLNFRRKSVLFLHGTPPIQGIVRATENGGVDPLDGSSLEHWDARMSQIFSAFLRSNEDVFQARLIAVADGGRELVRVDRAADGSIVAVPKEALQQKGDRNYFQEALRQPPQTAYISPVNLNQESGAVERPHRPTARVAVPVYSDARREAFGILIINVDLRDSIDQLLAASPVGGHLYVVSQDGDFIAHPDPSRRFASDLGHGHRWDDEFVQDGDRAGLTRFRHGADTVLAAERRLLRNPDDPSRYLRFIATLPEAAVTAELRGELLELAGWLLLIGLGAQVPIYFFWLAGEGKRLADQQRGRLAAFVENTSEAIVTLSTGGRVLSWNGGAQKLFGYSAEDAVGKALPRLIVPDGETTPEIDDLPRIATGGTAAVRELRRRRQDGASLWVEWRASGVRDTGGTVTEIVALMTDVSEARAARERLQTLNADLEAEVARRTEALDRSLSVQRAVVDNAGYAIIATDPDGLITLFNAAAERLLGYRSGEMVGKQTPAVFHESAEVAARAEHLSRELGESVAPGFDVFVIRARRHGDVDEQVWTYVCKDARRVPVRLAVTSLRDTEGVITGYLCMAVDLSETQQRERQLTEARELAEAATKAKSQFLANMSHEIRTPMNAVLGMLQLLRRTPLSFAQSDYAAKAESAARTLLGILNDILDFSKIEAGKLMLDPHPFMVDALLRDLGVILGANVGTKDLEVLYDIDPALPQRVTGDSLRLQQILLNLAGNAVKFTERGEVIVSASLLSREGDSLRLRFDVRDTGIGMTSEQLARVFEGFEQAQASTTRKYGGTGLGLAISQRLVQMMGGQIRASSEPGRGSRFSFEIDLRAAGGSGETLASVGADPNLHDLRVLIVDDNDAAREILAAMTAAFGWRVETAVSGAEALQMVEAQLSQGQNYDVVFVDWRMPDMDGWSASERIRRITRVGKPPLIVMATARGREALAQRMEAARDVLDGFLVKPITASMLFNAVADARAGHGRLWAENRAVAGQKRLEGLRLLVVEDNPTNQQVARELLTGEGALVSVASGGIPGVDAVRRASTPFDAVLMDIQMPDLDGYGATARIRDELGERALPIIAMTANAMPSDRSACLAAGMNDHIGKPFHIDDLVASLCKHTGHGGGASAAATAAASARAVTPDASPPGFAFSAAISRLGGNARLFASEARAFGKRYLSLADALPDAGRTGQIGNYLAELHSLKGVAGTLGATELARLVSELEQGIKAGGVPLETGIRAVAEWITAAAGVLSEEADRRDPSPSREPGPAATLRPEECDARLGELMEQIGRNDMRALDTWAGLKPLLASGPEADLVEAALESLDFAKALAHARNLRGERGQS
ncbi:response regulator [Panacagrimonas sp.]|uniref:response regulator n=1 Tax=Panacagrimonas sp. TaxID=2480088 RepID=UPI003B51909C